LSSSPAKTTAVVVPSPTSASWVLAISTIILAAGCSMSISLRIVTPSLVMTTSPRVSTIILSMPLGPRVVRTAPATALAAMMFDLCASRPAVLWLPSLRMSTGVPPNCPAAILFPPNRIRSKRDIRCLNFYIKASGRGSVDSGGVRLWWCRRGGE